VCPAGMHFDAQGGCVQCEVGFYQSALGQSQCTACAEGRTTDARGSLGLKDCRCISPKIAKSEGDASSICVCPPGTKIGGAGCDDCGMDSYQDERGAFNCKPCPPGSQSKDANSTDVSQCQCSTYHVDTTLYADMPHPAGGKCLSCERASRLDMGNLSGNAVVLIEAAVCPGPILDSRMFTRRGFWRSSPNSHNFYRCEKQEWCDGAGRNCTLAMLNKVPVGVPASQVCSGEDHCGSNRRGVKCWDCQPGFGTAGCIKCPEEAAKWFLIVLGGFVAMAALLYCQLCAQKPDMPKTLVSDLNLPAL
jgi:hypothetical protein